MTDERRSELRREEDREVLLDHGFRIGRLERDMSQVQGELDILDTTYAPRMEIERDYVPRREHHQHSLDRRSRIMLAVAIASVLASPFVAAAAQAVIGR